MTEQETVEQLMESNYKKKLNSLSTPADPLGLSPNTAPNPRTMTAEQFAALPLDRALEIQRMEAETHTILGIDAAGLVSDKAAMTATAVMTETEAGIRQRKETYLLQKRLSNSDIRNNLQDYAMYFLYSYCSSAFTYWIHKLNPSLVQDNDLLASMRLHKAIVAFNTELRTAYDDKKKLKVGKLHWLISNIIFNNPDIGLLTGMDLRALADQTTYMIVREEVCHG